MYILLLVTTKGEIDYAKIEAEGRHLWSSVREVLISHGPIADATLYKVSQTYEVDLETFRERRRRRVV